MPSNFVAAPIDSLNHLYGSIAGAGATGDSTAITIAANEQIWIYRVQVSCQSASGTQPFTMFFRLGASAVETFGFPASSTGIAPAPWSPPEGRVWTNLTAGNFVLRIQNNSAATAQTFWADIFYEVRKQNVQQ